MIYEVTLANFVNFEIFTDSYSTASKEKKKIRLKLPMQSFVTAKNISLVLVSVRIFWDFVSAYYVAITGCGTYKKLP